MKRFVCIDIEMSEINGKSRRNVHGMRHEVIQIGAVMLDEHYNQISSFSTFVKPTFSTINQTIEDLTGITNEMVENADDFITAFDKYCYWLRNEDVTTFCWSDSDYNQLWNEINLKAQHRTDLLDTLKTFVNLQKTFGDLLNAPKAISLESAVKLTNEKFEGQQHTALSDAFNTAKILHKICCSKSLNPHFEHLYLSAKPETELSSKKTHAASKFDSDYTISFASFMSPELLAQFGIERKGEEVEAQPLIIEEKPKNKSRKGLFSKLQKKFLCSKYNVQVKDWLQFYVKIMFTKGMRVAC